MIESTRKITISLPHELVEFADHRAQELNTSRSQIIGMALSAAKAQTETQLAVEGYQFYADENAEFAAVSADAAAEAWSSWSEMDGGEGMADDR